jgi:tetratricopeptide (TPR) repeat protein
MQSALSRLVNVRFLIWGLLVCLVLGALGTYGVFYWKERTQVRLLNLQYEAGLSAYEDARWDEALRIVDFATPSQTADNWTMWKQLELEISVASLRPSRLERLFRKFPDDVAKSEKALLALGRIEEIRETDNWKLARDKWKDISEYPHLWMALEADLLVAEGKLEEALSLLNARSFPGVNDTGRLNRLAILADTRSSLLESFNLLSESIKKDSQQPETRLFRAQVLEQTSHPNAARIDYVAAYVSSGGNPYLCNKLAEFYLRQGNKTYAIKTWFDECLSQFNPVFAWRIWVWNRLVAGKWKMEPLIENRTDLLGPFLTESFQMPAGVFWNSALENVLRKQSIPDAMQYEIKWLKVVEAIRGLNEDLIQTELMRLYHDIKPEDKLLAVALLRLNKVRREGDYFQPNVPSLLQDLTADRTHTYLLALETAAHSAQTTVHKLPEIQKAYLTFAQSPMAYMAAFMAAGWIESAVSLFENVQDKTNLPDWVAYGLSKAIFMCRSPEEALSFLDTQPKTPYLNLVRAEIWSHQGLSDNAEKLLIKILESDPDDKAIAERCAWMLSNVYLARDDSSKVLAFLSEHDGVLGETRSKEIMANAYIIQGETQRATELYDSISQVSYEAKMYLAKVAYENRQWDQARRMTLELIEHFPNQMELYQNLQRINAADSAGN